MKYNVDDHIIVKYVPKSIVSLLMVVLFDVIVYELIINKILFDNFSS